MQPSQRIKEIYQENIKNTHYASDSFFKEERIEAIIQYLDEQHNKNFFLNTENKKFIIGDSPDHPINLC